MCVEAYRVILGGAAFGADLGSSSKHSAENPCVSIDFQVDIDSFESPRPEAGADKGFSSTAVERELVGPKLKASPLKHFDVNFFFLKS